MFYRRNQIIRYITGFDAVDFLHDDTLGRFVGFVHLLVSIIVRYCKNHDTTGVTACVTECSGTLYITVDVHAVQETRLTIGEEVQHELQHFLILIAFLAALISPYNLGSVAEFVVLGRVTSKRRFFIGRTFGQLFRHKTRESFLNHRLCSLTVEVADNNQRHVVGHIPRIVELNEFRQTRVFQMLGQTDHITFVRTAFEDVRIELIAYL